MSARGSGTAASNDLLTILSGTSQNVAGIGVAAVATLGAQVLITRTLGASLFGVVTVMTQAAFVLSFVTRAGMDMAVLRDVAIRVGSGQAERVRSHVSRAVVIAALVSTVVSAMLMLSAGAIRELFSIDPERGRWVVESAALGLPFLAIANVWLAATRGLKIMRHTLYIFWAGQPLGWIVLMVGGWMLSRSAWMTVLAYSVSWMFAALAAALAWRRESARWDPEPLREGDMSALVRFAGPRAPAALFAQLLFWTDLFILTRYASQLEVGVYSAALRGGQVLVLFLTSVSLMFSPYVADLHSKGETQRLDRLFKTMTRWILAATLPAFLVLAVTPGSVLRVFGDAFSDGRTALLILLAGQLVNVATGSAGFVLIMAGRTGWDLVVHLGAVSLSAALTIVLAPRYGIEGAAAANAVTFATSNLARLALVRRFVRIQPYDRDYVRLLGPAAAGGAVMLAVHALTPDRWVVDLIATATLGGLAYVAAYLVLGLTEAERRAVAGLRRRIQAR